jgi:hypothetical protein
VAVEFSLFTPRAPRGLNIQTVSQIHSAQAAEFQGGMAFNGDRAMAEYRIAG